MAVSSTTSRKDYEATGGQTVFAYDFYILDQTHIEVYQNSVLKTLTTHYTVSGVGNPAGGNVTLVTGATAGDDLTIIRNVPIKQETDYIDASKFPAETHETALDKLTMIAQQLAEKIGRAATFAVSSLLTAPVLPDGVIGKLLRWKTATELENVSLTGTGTISIPVPEADGGTGGTSLATQVGLKEITFTKPQHWGKGSNVASAAALDLSADGNYFHVTGTTTITSIETRAAGSILVLEFEGILTVTHNATTLILQDGTNFTTKAGDVLVFVSEGSGNWREFARGGGGGKPAFLLKPESADMPTSAFPERKRNVGTNWTDYTLDFDQTTAEYVYFTVSIPTGVTFAGAVLEVTFRMPTVTTNAVVWELISLTRAEGEAWDTAGNTDTFAAETVPGTAGLLGKVTKTLTVTGWAAGETVLLKFGRKAADAGDTAAEDAKFMEAVLRLT